MTLQIPCQQCLLRPLRLDDAASLAKYANDRDVARNLRDRFPHPYQRSDAEAFITHVSREPVQTDFGIVVDSEVIGAIGLISGEDVNRRSAEVGYWIGKPFWGRGIAAEALRAATRYGFETLDFARIFATPFSTAIQSMRVLEKAGYVREGVMRRNASKDVVLLDQMLYAAYAM